MTVAVVIPCFNEDPTRLAGTVWSALTFADLVVIVDDGSATPVKFDDSITYPRAVVERIERNVGPAAAMNRGVERAIAEGASHIARIDVGDTFRPEPKLRQIEVSAAAVFSRHHNLVTGEDFTPPDNWRTRIFTDGAFCICTMVVHVDVWREVGGFDPSLRYGDDWDFAARLQHAIGWTYFDEVTCEAGAFPGGHTQTAALDPVKRARRDADTARIRDRLGLLRSPDRYRHLADPKWRAKRGLAPL